MKEFRHRMRTACIWLGAVIFAVSVPWSLRAAVVDGCTEYDLAAAIAAGGTISFACSGEISISQAIVVTNEVVLEAEDDVQLVGSGNTRIFEIAQGASLTLSNMTLSGGETTNGGGGAIFNRGTLVLLACTVSNNIANGPAGRDGRDSTSGDTNGGDGQSGANGKRTAGGAIYNMGIFRAVESGFYDNRAVGGNGGSGGDGNVGELTGGDGGDGGSGGSALGGAIFNAGVLEIRSCGLYGNSLQGGDAGEGGQAGDSLFPGRVGNGGRGGLCAGGAIYSTNKTVTLIVGSTFSVNTVLSGNSARSGTSRNSGEDGPAGPNAYGGGFCNYGRAVVVNSTFNENEIRAGNGGDGGDAEFVPGEGGDGGTSWGGNMFNAGPSAAVTNCTFNGGLARPGTNGLSGVGTFEGKDGDIGRTRGANIGNGKGKFALSLSILSNPPSTNSFRTNTTITWVTNTIENVLGGTNADQSICTRVRELRTDGSVIRDSFTCTDSVLTGSNIVAKTTVTVTTNTTRITLTDNRANASGAFKDGGYNLSSDHSIPFKKKSTSRSNLDPLLGPLEDNGGPTETMELLSGSPAIDKGNPDFVLETDQRGVERPQGYIGDIGAFEIEVGPPVSEDEPEDVSVFTGENASFVWGVSGRDIHFQWFFNGSSPIAGATNSTLLLTNIQLAKAGTYHATATNLYGSITSQDATLTVTESAPIFTQMPPASTNVAAGATLTLVAQATGSRPLQFQWYFTNQSSVTSTVTNGTNATLVIPSFGAVNEGNYTLEVSNALGTILSDSTMVQRIGALP